ncbi:MAG TPA: hypothetical protein VGM88_24015 [Kofleriaceae bacterium]|jgi:hypothetical protein
MPAVIRDQHLAQLYAQALVAVARAHEAEGQAIGAEEGDRIADLIVSRTGAPAELEELLLSPPLRPAQLAEAFTGTPFREGLSLSPSAFAELLVADILSVTGTKGYLASEERRLLDSFARALGLTDADLSLLRPSTGDD